MPKSMVPPSVLLEAPLCAEVMGAGFQRLPFSDVRQLVVHKLTFPAV